VLNTNLYQKLGSSDRATLKVIAEILQYHINRCHEDNESSDIPILYRNQGKIAMAREILSNIKKFVL